MAMTCGDPSGAAASKVADEFLAPALRRWRCCGKWYAGMARRCTPTISARSAQIARVKAVLPMVEVLYSLKANASLGLCGFIAAEGLGADVASAGELVTAVEAGFPPERILVSGPDKSPALLELLPSIPGAVLSVDSVSELELLAQGPGAAGAAAPAA